MTTQEKIIATIKANKWKSIIAGLFILGLIVPDRHKNTEPSTFQTNECKRLSKEFASIMSSDIFNAAPATRKATTVALDLAYINTVKENPSNRLAIATLKEAMSIVKTYDDEPKDLYGLLNRRCLNVK